MTTSDESPRRRWLPVAVDLLIAFLAAGLCFGLPLLAADRWPRAFERAILIAPAVVFPLLVAVRSRRALSPLWTAWRLIPGAVAVFGVLAWLTQGDLRALVPPLAIVASASLVAAGLGRAARSRSASWLRGALCGIAPGAAIGLLVPLTMSGLLTHGASQPEPEWTLRLLDGSTLSSTSTRGRVVVLNFWGVWCAPCVRELPELERAAERAGSAGDAVFVAVDSARGRETEAEVRAFASEHGLHVPVAYEADRATYSAFGVTGLPTTLVIDRDGRIRYRRFGFSVSARYADWLQGVVDELASEPAG